jgi:hypothetical protein
MPEVLEPSRDIPVVLFMVPLARPVSPGPDRLVVTELLAGPLSAPPLPWLDCARAGAAAMESMQAAAKIVFFISSISLVSVQANQPFSEAFLEEDLRFDAAKPARNESPVACLIPRCFVELVMSISAPSIVPRDDDQNVYLVIDDLGRLGRVWREADAEATDLETVINDLLGCQYANPVRVVAFNTAEGWVRDVSEDVAIELRHRCNLQLTELPPCLEEFVGAFETGSREQLSMRLV